MVQLAHSNSLMPVAFVAYNKILYFANGKTNSIDFINGSSIITLHSNISNISSLSIAFFNNGYFLKSPKKYLK